MGATKPMGVMNLVGASKLTQKESPKTDTSQTEPGEKPCDEEPGVFYPDIVRAYGKVVQKIIRLIIKVIRYIWVTFYSFCLFIIGFCIFLTPFLPGFIVIFCVATLLTVLWDKVTKPIIIMFIKGYNVIAGAWNGFANVIRFVGINERFFGTRIRFKIFGIDLPNAPVAETNLPGFWEFVYRVLTPDVIKKKVLSKIFREKGYIPPPQEQNCLTKI